MTALAEIIRARIAREGPMTVAEYMSLCLMHPDHGYYARGEPIGAAGDFITAPEVSQMFGELLGLALAQAWLDQGRPAPFVLAEPGPGRGTLMADALRATRGVPGFHEALELHLVEGGKRLRAVQAETLRTVALATGAAPAPVWHASVDGLPGKPLFLIANEFLDALPIRQFQRTAHGWRERMIGLEEGRLVFGLGPETAVPALEGRLADTAPGDIVETSAPVQGVVHAIAERIARHGGAAIFIDYGDWRSRGDTFQAVRAHQTADPLAAPGQADLTAHVDFEAVSRAIAAAGARPTAVVPQGQLLAALGIGPRAAQLARGKSPAEADAIADALERLTDAREMGTLFKAVAAVPRGAPVPPGFTT
ncbi:MAG: class I SAM-dependent methyltransferase [Alphaproteobacteria bacterium]|nr:MAG: class I SAM-dependent methyltransferase [Alphaproteobacteria bacterium]